MPTVDRIIDYARLDVRLVVAASHAPVKSNESSGGDGGRRHVRIFCQLLAARVVFCVRRAMFRSGAAPQDAFL